MDDAAAATRAIARRAELLDPDVTTTTAFMKADRGGRVFLDATRTGGATVAARRTARAHAPACRCRSPSPGTSSTLSSLAR